jgi:hypothetical protein
LLILNPSQEIHRNCYKIPKTMKFVSKFKLELPLAWQALVAPGHGILLGLGLLFPYGQKWRLNYLAVIFVVMILATDRNTLACHAL